MKKPIEIKVSETGCHEVVSHSGSRGYAKAYVDGKDTYLHRYVWEKYHNKVIQNGFVIMHTCDNRKCVNINHLKLGTQTENVQDMHDKNRGYRYRLDGTFIKPLRLLKGLSLPQLAVKCGVNRSLIWKIEQGQIMTTQNTLDKILVVLGGVTNG